MKKSKIILVLVALIIILSIVLLEKTRITPKLVKISESTIQKGGNFPQAPELVGISGYLNTDSNLKISDLKGKVVLIDFWTYTCINCIRTLPFLTEWDRKYRDKGLVIIGVHTPEFEFEKKRENVEDAIKKYNIEYAVVQDNDYATWSAFRNRYWPRKYLIDAEGLIRYDHIGEGSYEETERMIQSLLLEIGKDVTDMDISTLEDQTPNRERRTPELYAGHSFALSRGQNVGNKEGLQPGKEIDYTISGKLKPDTIYLQGSWKSNPDDLLAQEPASIIIGFTARSINIVADSISSPIEMEVLIDDEYITEEQAGDDVQFKEGKAFILVDKPQLYNVYRGDYMSGKLTLKVDSNFFFSAFTFG